MKEKIVTHTTKDMGALKREYIFRADEAQSYRVIFDSSFAIRNAELSRRVLKQTSVLRQSRRPI